MEVPNTKFIADSLVLLAIACVSSDVATAHEQGSDAAVLKAESLLRVRESAAPLIGASPKTNAAKDRVYANTQKALLKSPFILTAALRQPGIRELSLIKNQEQPLAWLARNIKCEFVDDSRILRVSLSGKNPRELRAIVDAVVEAYLYEIVQAEKTENSKRLQALRNQRRENEQAVREKLEIVHQLAEEVGSVDSDQGRLLRELNLHELKLLFDRRERLTSKIDDVSDELQVLEALSSEAADSGTHELQKQTRVIKLRKGQLKVRIDAVEARIAESRQELTQTVGFSSDLEVRKSEITNLQEATAEIVEAITRMELELRGLESRVQRIQPAVVAAIAHGNARQKDLKNKKKNN